MRTLLLQIILVHMVKYTLFNGIHILVYKKKKYYQKLMEPSLICSCLDEDESRNKEGRFFSLQFPAFAVISLKNWCEFPNTVIIASFCKIKYRELFKTKSQASKFAVLLCCISSAFYLIKNVDCDELAVRMGQNWELV